MLLVVIKVFCPPPSLRAYNCWNLANKTENKQKTNKKKIAAQEGRACSHRSGERETILTRRWPPITVDIWAVLPCIPLRMGDFLHSPSLQIIKHSFTTARLAAHCFHYISSSELCMSVFRWQQLLLDSCNWLPSCISQARVDIVVIEKYYLSPDYTWTTFKSWSKNNPTTLDSNSQLFNSFLIWTFLSGILRKASFAHIFHCTLKFLCIPNRSSDLL